MSGSTPGPRASRRSSSRRTPWLGIVLIGLALILLFGAGFGLSKLIKNSSGGGGGGASSSSGSNSPTDTPQPCVTVTVYPGKALPKPSEVKTNVFNATDREGLAGNTSKELEGRGFQIANVANDPLGKGVTGVAEIRYGTAGASAAQLMAYYIPGALLVKDSRTDATIDTVLGAAFVAVAPQSDVDAALAAPSPSPSGAGCPTTPAPSTSSSKPDTGEPSTTPEASAS